MSEKYTLAYPMILFPYDFSLEDYKIVLKNNYPGMQIDQNLNLLFLDGILINNAKKVFLNKDYERIVNDEYDRLPFATRVYIIKNLKDSILNLFRASSYFQIVDLYFQALESNASNESLICKELEKQIYDQVSKNDFNSAVFADVIKIFSSRFICDETKKYLIGILYNYNQNALAIHFYNTIQNKYILNTDTWFKLESACFMLSQFSKAEEIMNKIKVDNADNNEVLTALQIVELINRFESDISDKSKLQETFSDMLYKVENMPNCANLLLKISSSLLPHEDAIYLMTHSKLNDNSIQIYNNIGALYLVQGYRKYIKAPKDKIYLNKAKKYLDFAKLLGQEREEYSPYLELNGITCDFCHAFIKRHSTKTFKNIYERYLKIRFKCDSIYFRSIVYCNCYILEKMTTNAQDKLQDYKKILDDINADTTDTKIKEKIKDFTSFSPDTDVRLPLWIITETHY